MSNSFVNLRQDDVRLVMGEQIRTVLQERIERFFTDKDNVKAIGPAQADVYERELSRFLDEFISLFERGGTERALLRLVEYESSARENTPEGTSAAYMEFLDGLFQQMRSYMATSERLAPIKPSRKTTMTDTTFAVGEDGPSPIEVESALSPLSNSWRIQLLMLLLRGDESLAALSKEIGLQKGHLQFHLNSLIGADYIRYERKTHLYSVTPRGRKAIEGALKLAVELNSGAYRSG